MMLPTTHGSVFQQNVQRDDQLLYFMIKPHPEQALAMDALRRQYDLSRQYAADRFHITLLPFGDIRMISPEDLALIRRAAASLCVEPFEVTLNRIRGNALVGSKMRPLRALQRTLATRLESFGVDLIDHAFKPHASLTYQEWQQRNFPVSPISWRVEQLLLVNSIHGKGHKLMGSWDFDRQGSFAF